MVDVTTKVQIRGPMGHPLEVPLADLLGGDKTAARAAIGAEGPGDLAAIALSGAASDLVGPIAATQLAGGFAKHALVNGGAAGDIAVAAIKTGDELDEVLEHVYTTGAVTDIVDLTAEFTIKAGNGVINNAAGTNTTGNKLLVRWTKKTA